jgi:hypothetical protein
VTTMVSLRNLGCELISLLKEWHWKPHDCCTGSAGDTAAGSSLHGDEHPGSELGDVLSTEDELIWPDADSEVLRWSRQKWR